MSAVLASEIFPTRLRMVLMSWLGCEVSAKTSVIWAGAFFGSKNFSIGEEVLINRYFFFDGSSRLTIGKNVHIGSFVRVITGSHEIDPNPLFRCGEYITGPVAVGEGCWDRCRRADPARRQHRPWLRDWRRQRRR
jgi:maltose O-acetyltransferase